MMWLIGVPGLVLFVGIIAVCVGSALDNQKGNRQTLKTGGHRCSLCNTVVRKGYDHSCTGKWQ